MMKFRRMEEADIPSRVAALNSRSVLSGILIESPVSEGQTFDWFSAVRSSDNRRDFVCEVDGDVAGFSGLVQISRTNRTAELYIFIVERFQGAGIGTELLRRTLGYAAAEANLRKVTLFVSQSNARAAKFYERLGFKREGLLKEHVWHRGRYQDRYIYSIFLDDAGAPVFELHSNFLGDD